MTAQMLEGLAKTRPLKSLVKGLSSSGGRNNQGRITVRYRGGGHKRLYRIIDFTRRKQEVPATVISIEYDPNRSARIALLQYRDGERRYILWPHGLRVGETVVAGPRVEIKTGNALPLSSIPVGTVVHNVELQPEKGGQLARSAGSSCLVRAKEGQMAHLRLPSGEIRLVRVECMATVGQVGNLEHEKVSVGKAGRSRWHGRRPHVRGVAMNPVDHPHGGGEGKAGQGNPHPVSPWGQPTKGYKTRRRKATNRFILKRRK